MIDTYPLAWPPGWPRTDFPRRSAFFTSPGRANANLRRELSLLGATDIVVSSNIPITRDGVPYARFRKPEDTGVAVYFKRDGKDQCIPCDKWNEVGDNIHAIELCIAALRGLDRWGAKTMVDAAFTGFKALPAGGESAIEMASPHQILGIEPSASKHEIVSAYRKLAHEHHPDKGGDIAQFNRIKQAYEAIS